MENQYVSKRAIQLQKELNTLDSRINSETDIVLKEAACHMFDARKQHMYAHAGRHPLEFAQLIVDGVIDAAWAGGLFTGDYDTKKYRKQIKTILAQSDDTEVQWFINNR